MTRLSVERAPALTPAPVVVNRRCTACGNESTQAECPECAGEDRDPEQLDEQEFSVSPCGGPSKDVAPGIVHDVIEGAGAPLTARERSFFEPRLGHDFSRVRVHSDMRAAEAARAVDADAFTVGRHVVLGGRHRDGLARHNVLAHELAHVVQQSGGAAPPRGELRIAAPDHATEREADAVAHAVARAVPAAPHERSDQQVARQSGGGLVPSSCPCCITGLSIANITRIDNATHMGHSFDLQIAMDRPSSGPAGECVLEWWEKTDVPAIPGHPPNTWTDMFANFPTSPTFAPWHNRGTTCSSSQGVTINDPPSLGKRAGRTVTRTLEFRLVVNSMPASSDSGCAEASKQVTAKQVLVMTSGTPDWTASSFTTP
ncbi:DUF4157 domain-containing protein [Sphingomonas parva]|uniref:DUF4157 domain-containing protein n=1 Tax=Sphingomonas parva TaxID=2555898 RepID=A0A4Y8ZLP9_9SPHN|nr:DUF4157 domain-containing protein [Sphingomonas parva]TFI56931.1 DUF4157 domain-containing protein [Sphingomonas parva]